MFLNTGKNAISSLLEFPAEGSLPNSCNLLLCSCKKDFFLDSMLPLCWSVGFILIVITNLNVIASSLILLYFGGDGMEPIS